MHICTSDSTTIGTSIRQIQLAERGKVAVDSVSDIKDLEVIMAPYATGLIKQVSHLKKIPKGKLRILVPISMRGLEVEFLIQNVDIPKHEQELLTSGMTLQLKIMGDMRNGLVGHDLKPMKVAEYFGSVIKVPAAGNDKDKVIVSLDLTLDSVEISQESIRAYNAKQPLACGDYCVLAIRWQDWIKALSEKKRPQWELVEVIDKAKSARPRSQSQGRESKSTMKPIPKQVQRLGSGGGGGGGEISFEELSPQHDRQPRPKENCHPPHRRRSRSVNFTPIEDDFQVPQYHQYVRPAINHYQYAPRNAEMMCGPYGNFYAMPPMWMTPNLVAPYMPRNPQ